MKSIKLYFLGLLLLACTSCTTSDIWLGEDKKEKLSGERITILPEAKILEIDLSYQNYHVSIPAEQNITTIDKSTGINSTRYPNLKLADNLTKSRSFSFYSSKLFTSATSPIFVNDKVVLLETDGDLVAYDLNSGKKQWDNGYFRKKSNRGLISLSPNFYEGGLTFSNGIVYATAGLNEVIAVNAESGEVLWAQTIGNSTRSTPLILNDRVFIQTTDNNTYALNLNSGEIIWTHLGIKGEVSMISSASPAISGHTLIVQHSTGTLVGIDAATGNEIWTLEVTSEIERLSIQQQVHDVVHKPLVDGFTIVAYGNDGIIGVFNLQNGQPYWKKDLGINRPVWICGELLLAITKNKELIAINKNDGRVKWMVDLSKFEDSKIKGAKVWVEPIVANSEVIVVNSQGQLFKFDINNGAKLGDMKVAEHVYMAPLVVNEKLYLISSQGAILEYTEK